MLCNTTDLTCDVLVVGGGGAALVAALEAKRLGADVLLVSKGQIGRSGNTMIAGSGFSAYVPDRGNIDSEDVFIHDTLVGGKKLNNEKLVEILVRHSYEAIRDLERYGVPFLKVNGEYVRRTPPGHSRPRSFPTVYDAKKYSVRGLSITLPLRRAAEEQGIRFLESSPVIQLLKALDQVCGAVAINLKSQELNVISAKAVIIATGGAGRVYAETNNTRDVTGDGYALALEVGASLQDMEFVQFYPTMMTKPLRFPVSTPLFGDGAVLRNAAAERFLQNYDPAGDMTTRDIMARASFSEVLAGRGVNDGVYIDCSGIPTDILNSKFKVFRDFLTSHNLDPQRDWFIVSPTVHFFMGGIRIDEKCRSEILGLYAAGEVTGGLHGANRLSGNALTETAVFGKIAGREAAQFASSFQNFAKPCWKVNIPTGHGSEGLQEIRRLLREGMWRDVSILRSEKSLQNAWEVLNSCQNGLENVAIHNLRDWAKYEETRSMLTVARTVVKAAIERRESRGSHFRTDYPIQDDDRWYGNTIITYKNQHLEVEFKEKNSEKSVNMKGGELQKSFLNLKIQI